MAQRIVKTLISVATKTTPTSVVGSVRADYRFDDGGLQRSLFGYLGTGQKINVYVYPDEAHSIEHLETTISAGSSSYTTATQSFLEVLNGPFFAIEVRTVTSGSAIVVAVI